MIRRRTLLAALGLMPAIPAAAAIPPSQPEPPAPTGNVKSDQAVGIISWKNVDGVDSYKITVIDLTSGMRTWRVQSSPGTMNTLTFPAVRNRTYKVKVEAVHPDGSRRNAERYDLDFA